MIAQPTEFFCAEERPLETIVNLPIDTREYEDRVALLRLEARQRALTSRFCKPDHLKNKKMRLQVRETYARHGYPKELKDKWLRESVYLEYLSRNRITSYDEIEPFLNNVCNCSTFDDLTLHKVIDMFSLPYKCLPTGIGYNKGDKTPEQNFVMHFARSLPNFNYEADWITNYVACEKEHVMWNEHHPEYHDAPMMSIDNTVHCLIDLWASAFRLCISPIDAFYEMHKWILDITPHGVVMKEKFKNFHPVGMFYFYKQLLTYGISSRNYALPHRLYLKRRKVLSLEVRNINFSLPINNQDVNVVSKSREYHHYMGDLKVHRNLVYSIGKHVLNRGNLHPVNRPALMRGLALHDMDKLSYVSSRLYAYRWNIHDKIIGNEVTCASGNCENPFCSGNCKTYDCTNNLKEHVGSVFAGIKSTLSGMVPENVHEVFDKLKSSFEEISQVVMGLANKVKSVLIPISKFLGLDGLDIGMETAINVVKMYIVYINTSSSILQTYCIYQILSDCGLFKILTDALLDFYGPTMQNTEGDVNSFNEATSFNSVIERIKSMFSALLSVDPKVVAVPLGFLVFVLFGIKLSGKHVTSIGSDFVNTMKNFHFIGAGMLGIGKFVETLISAIKFVFDWAGKKFFNKQSTEEKQQKKEEEFLQEFADWVAQVEELALEENAPKMAHQQFIQDKVEKLYTQGVDYNKMHLKNEMIKQSVPTFVRVWRSCKQIYNIVLRAKSIHNFRPTPFHVQMFGPPGIGKSTLTQVIADKIRQKFYPTNTNHIYAQPQNEQCDNYHGQPIWLIDDANAVNDYKMSIMLLTMISNCPCPLLCSHLEAKGTMFTSDWVLSTTNTPWPEFTSVFSHEALWRRRHILVEVNIDPRVMDPGTGKFSENLFREYYADVDTTTFPHLNFTLMNPVRKGQELGKLKILPTGIVEPTTNITFSKFMDMVFARSINQRKEEERFVADTDVKYNLIREHLSEIDTAYESFRDRQDVWKKAYEEYFEDNGKKTMPVDPANVKSSPHPKNFEPESESDDDELAEILTKCLTAMGSSVDFKHQCVLSIHDYVGRIIIDTDHEIPIRYIVELLVMTHYIRTFCASEEPGSVSANLANTLIKRVHDYILESCFVSVRCNYTYDSGIMLSDPEIWVSHIQASVSGDEIKHEYWFAFLQEYKCLVEYSENLAVDEITNFITLNLAKLNETTAGTSYAGETRNFHMPTDQTDFDDLLKNIESEGKTLVRDFMKLLSDYPTCDAALFINDNWSIETHHSCDLYDILKGLDVALANNIEYTAALGRTDFTNPDFAIREKWCQIVVTTFKLNTLRTEEKLRAKRDKHRKNKPKPENDTPKFEPEPPRTHYWFGSNIVNGRGSQITSSMGFGIYVTSRFGAPPIWTPIDPDLIGLPVYPSIGTFYLTNDEWEKVFGVKYLYTSGDTEISFSFLRTLSRHRNNNGDVEWWCNPQHVPDGFERTVNIGMLTMHMNKYVVLALDRKFRSSCDLWFRLSDEERNQIYALWLKHRFYVNIMRSYGIKVAYAAKNLFAKMWDKFTGSVKYLWTMAKKFKAPIALITMSAAIIGACTMFSKLFIPTAESTSFRASSIFASKGSNKAGFTSDPIISGKALSGIVRCHLEGAIFQGYKIYSQCLLAPYHVMAKVMSDNRNYLVTIHISPGVNHQFHINKENIFRFADTDLVLVYCKNFPQWGDRLKYLKSSEETTAEKDVEAIIAVSTPDGAIEMGQSVYGGEESSRTVTFSNSPKITYAKLGVLKCTVQLGVSGAPIFLKVHNRNDATISGFQSYRTRDERSYFTIITREAVESMLSMFKDKIIGNNGPFVLTEHLPSPETTSLLDAHMEVVCAVPPHLMTHQPGNSEFSKTRLHKYLPITRVPAILSTRDPKACGDPARHSLNKHGRDSTITIPPNIIKRAIDDYVAYLRLNISKPRKLTIIEAIQGVGSLRHIDLNTSPGIPWIYNRTLPGKKDYIRINESGDLEYLSPALVESVMKFERMMLEGSLPDFTMQEILKDELRPVTKAYGLTEDQVQLVRDNVPPALWPEGRTCKTRTITVMPMEYTIIYRMYFGDLISKMHKLAETGTFPFSVGINVESTAAANAYFKAASLNDMGFDLDVSNWDGHFGPQCANACVDFFNELYDDHFGMLRRTLCTGAIGGFVQYKDMIYRKIWGLPSGFPGTADMNTIWHMLMAYSFWLELCEDNNQMEKARMDRYFSLNLDLMYGDDRLVVPSKEISDWYNATSVVAKYNQYGWPTTSANKSGEINMRPLPMLTFLKRNWVVDPDDPFYIHWAIEKNTIETLLTYVRRTQMPRTQFRENVDNALDFAADWGRSYYEHLRSFVNTKCVNNEGVFPTTYDAIKAIKRARYFGPTLQQDNPRIGVKREYDVILVCDEDDGSKVEVKVNDLY